MTAAGRPGDGPGDGPGAARPLAALDLDKTLIFSARSARLPADAAAHELVEVERLDGAPLSFATARELALLAELDRAAVVVPVTTRTLAQYRRVDLRIRPRYAIAANGGHLLVDGEPDPAWAAAVTAEVGAACAPLAGMLALAERFAAGGWARVVRAADDLFVYLVAHSRPDIPDLTGFAADALAGGWEVSAQGRKVYLVPSVLTKQRAVDEVARRAGTGLALAAGDSVLDIPMLLAADAAVRPAHGELHELGWTAPRVTVTAAAGALAGEELVTALLQRVRATAAAPGPVEPATGAAG
ncbi:HAD family hydrolase [Frankia sp. AgKG'84/4]|uniref:sucrose-6-phosphate hydrolase n=1 Tax=Frankia sp. AgKG'84/4 TaxID=573490 RepID=UPI00200DC0E3|nr:sucrose-6-phosphate hydrolase [Frankia sp. AgKG'84/4]MCL9795561.1 sucrose-6-phosphate hydrolase [Frankia sp. AgKG'84/4]